MCVPKLKNKTDERFNIVCRSLSDRLRMTIQWDYKNIN